MNIRKRLTLVFIGMVVVILSISSLAVYFFSANHRQEDFYNRLRSKAINSAKLLIEVEEVDATLLAKMESDNPASLPYEKIVICNYQNEILYSSDSERIIPLNKELLDKIRLEQSVSFGFGDFEALGILYADRYDRFVVIAAAKDTFGKRKIRVLRNILLITFVVSIILVSLAGWIYSGRALKPISKVIDKVEAISETSLNLRIEEGNRYDEIGRLATNFNQMLARLEKAFAAQKNFIANASHELRTPLTAITGKIEVNLLQSRSIEEYQSVLNSLLHDTRNLNQLSDRLLMLAQTTAEGATKLVTSLRIDELLWQAKDDLTRSNKKNSVIIDFDLELDDRLLTINGDEQLLKAAIINLMDNGCKYSADHAIYVNVRANENDVVLTFADKGIGVPLEEQDKIFEPFYRARNAINITGHGIGLSLVGKVIKLHQGRITFESLVDRGTTFEVFLPIKQ